VKVGASCFPDQATTRYFMGGYSEFVDVQTGKYEPRAEGLHTSCLIGLRVAYGLTYNSSLYMPGRFLQGDMAVESGLNEKATPPSDTSRLQMGSAFRSNHLPHPASTGRDDWPTYRCNGLRTSRTSTHVPSELGELWATAVGGTPSPPTIADGRVFVALPEEHKVVALDAVSGKVLWSFTAGGRVRIPPTYHNGACLFGSADGHVYNLDASSGKLVWRFRAARTPRCIVVRGRVESAWPVDEGVLVHDGLAYFTAGRHCQVDGGSDVYAVDCVSGALAWHQQMTAGGTVLMLICDGKSLSMRNYRTRFALKAEGPRPPAPSFHEAAYARNKLSIAHILDRPAAMTIHPRGLVKTGNTVFALGCMPPNSGETPKIIWGPSRLTTVIVNRPDKHPLDGTNVASTTFKLWSFSELDGTKLSEIELDARPVFDGMAAAGGRLYVSGEDGKLRCFAGQ